MPGWNSIGVMGATGRALYDSPVGDTFSTRFSCEKGAVSCRLCTVSPTSCWNSQSKISSTFSPPVVLLVSAAGGIAMSSHCIAGAIEAGREDRSLVIAVEGWEGGRLGLGPEDILCRFLLGSPTWSVSEPLHDSRICFLRTSCRWNAFPH